MTKYVILPEKQKRWHHKADAAMLVLTVAALYVTKKAGSFSLLKAARDGRWRFFFLRDDGVGGFCCRRDYRKDEKGMIGRTAK